MRQRHNIPNSDLVNLAAFAEGLAHNSTITFLNLSENALFAEGARLIAQALVTNEGLTGMDFTDNDIGPEGARHFQNAFGTLVQNRKNTVLKFLVSGFEQRRRVQIHTFSLAFSHLHPVVLCRPIPTTRICGESYLY